MFDSTQYELLDFGDGRKLERLGRHVLDRPSPAAEGASPADPAAWQAATARYDRTSGEQGRWRPAAAVAQPWIVEHGPLRLELTVSPSGNLGLFPEQAENWDWLARQLRRAPGSKVLNLFAYTGGSTLACAAAGAEVVHVDAAKNILARARRNAELSGLAASPIRWIAEDALTFARREWKRGNKYDAVILDPPSYGHGPKGQPWKLGEQLAELLETCAALTEGQRAFMLLTCHTPGWGPAELSALLSDTVFGHCGAGVTARGLALTAADGRRLPAGVVARWP